MNNSKTYKEMTREELKEKADNKLDKFPGCGSNIVAFQTEDGDAGIYWDKQQRVSDNWTWKYIPYHNNEITRG